MERSDRKKVKKKIPKENSVRLIVVTHNDASSRDENDQKKKKRCRLKQFVNSVWICSPLHLTFHCSSKNSPLISIPKKHFTIGRQSTMIKEILRKGKFNDDDCRKVEPDDIVSILHKNAHILLKMKIKLCCCHCFVSCSVTELQSSMSIRQGAEISDRHIKCKVHGSQTHKIQFHPHDWFLLLHWLSIFLRRTHSSCASNVGKSLLISFDCEVLNVLFYHTVDVANIFFFFFTFFLFLISRVRLVSFSFSLYFKRFKC